MATYRVKLAYGDPGKTKSTRQDITVDATSDSVAIQLAINKFKSSNSTNRNKEVDAIEIKEI